MGMCNKILRRMITKFHTDIERFTFLLCTCFAARYLHETLNKKLVPHKSFGTFFATNYDNILFSAKQVSYNSWKHKQNGCRYCLTVVVRAESQRGCQTFF